MKSSPKVQSAMVGMIGWVISPMMLAHFALITPDAGATALGLGFMAIGQIHRVNRSANLIDIMLSGALAGLALSAKSTWLVVFPLIIVSDWIINVSFANFSGKALLTSMLRFATGLTCTLIILNSVYGWSDVGRCLRELPLRSNAMLAFKSSVVGAIPCPAPSAFILGIDLQKLDFENGYPSYLMGEWRHGGWWYYYLVGFLVKEPIGFQLMLYGSVLHGLWFWRKWTRESVREWSWIVIPPLLIFALVSSQTGFNHHLRYVLPAYPFLFIIAARTVTLGNSGSGFRTHV